MSQSVAVDLQDSSIQDKAKEKQAIVSLLSDYFANRDDIDAAILYGSFASGKFHAKSDIDIAIHSKSPLSYDTIAEIQVALSLLCHREVDVADLARAEGLFLHQIMTKGERVKFNHDVFHKYIMKALYFYEDYLPIQRACRAEAIRRMCHG